MNIDAIKARLGSISPKTRREVGEVSPAAEKILKEDMPMLISEVQALRILLVEDDTGEDY